MLIMRRRAGESILIGDDIELHITEIGRSRVKIAIRAPRHVPVVAKEVKETAEQNRAAAAPLPDLNAIARAYRNFPSSTFPQTSVVRADEVIGTDQSGIR